MNSTGQGFAEVTNLPLSYIFDTADGVIGLGLQGGSKDFKPFFYNLFVQNNLRSPVFSFYVNRFVK